MNTLKALPVSVYVTLLTALCAPPTFAAEGTDVKSPAGAWQKHEYSFQYMGFTSTYSCDGLADKLNLLLKASGARKDFKVTSGGCSAGFGRPDKFARAYLTFYTLSPAEDAAAPDSTSVPGVWRSVTLTDRTPRDLQTGDCELVDQFRTLVLPLFTTRSVQNKTSCIPHQISGSIIDLRFDTFSAAPVMAPAPKMRVPN